MCYSRENYGLEEEARRLRKQGAHGRWREEAKARRAGEREHKPLTQKAREVTGHAGRAG